MKIEDTKTIKNSGGELILKALNEAKERLKQVVVSRLTDTHGVIGYETNKVILCAKKYIFGNIVSCHKGLLKKAIDTDKKLLMYIEKANKFYAFDPNTCLKNGVENKRGANIMVNFKIREGYNYEEAHNTTLDNF